MNEQKKNLEEVVAQRPYPEYMNWWPLGAEFTHFMAEAIVTQWRALAGNEGTLDVATEYARHYLDVVYVRTMRRDLVEHFGAGGKEGIVQSGEFDALSYAFFHAAFDLIAAHPTAVENGTAVERRLFTKRVGRDFYSRVHTLLQLDLPAQLQTTDDVTQLQREIDAVGGFLVQQGYLRDHFAFRFDVDVTHSGQQIRQSHADLLSRLANNGVAYALYEMGYPVILPSAVYLYHTVGEAQHHSSRTIEELFARVGCDARETADFDPLGFPSDMVVELWEIGRLG